MSNEFFYEIHDDDKNPSCAFHCRVDFFCLEINITRDVICPKNT